MRRIAIVGAGQSGLQLGLGLLGAGYEVTVLTDRSADEVGGGTGALKPMHVRERA